MSTRTAAPDSAYPTFPVAPLQQVLSALGDPVRLEIVRRLLGAGAPVPCAQLYDDISKSTASHHLKILREAGITERVVDGGRVHQSLRRSELEAVYPHLVGVIDRS